MPLRLSDDVRNAKVNAAVDQLDAGPGAGYIEIREGAQPATPATAASGTLLATVTLADPAFGDAGATNVGEASLNDPASVNAVATGTAGWARFYDSTGAAKFDGHVTATGGGGVVTLSSTSLTATYAVDITGGTYSQPM